MNRENRNYYPNLDIIRFLAALWVVLTHYGHIGPYLGLTGYGPSEGILATFFQYGYLGVPIFFILSGFVIAHVSIGVDPLKFLSNRILRLMPAFWGCMTISLLLITSLGETNVLDIKLWFANLFLLPQVFGQPFVDGVYWTLVLELVFYAWVFVLLLSGLFHKHLLKICGFWLALSFANNLYLENHAFELLFITYYSGAFIAGLVMWHAKQNSWVFSHTLLIVFAMASLSFGIEHLGVQSQLPNFNNQPDLLTSAICALFSIGMVAAGIYGKSIPVKRSFAVMLGAISYPLYLIHQEVGYLLLQVFNDLGYTSFEAGARVLVMIILVSFIIHVIIEKPIRSVLKACLDKVVSFTLPKTTTVIPAE